jgi:hypothetical protein
VIFIVVGIGIIVTNLAIMVVAIKVDHFWLTVREYIFHVVTLPIGIGCVIHGIRCMGRQDEQRTEGTDRIAAGDEPEHAAMRVRLDETREMR